jgi:hypothetical protein
MTDYRRNRVPGGIFFFSFNLYNRRSRLRIQDMDVFGNKPSVMRATMPPTPPLSISTL